MPEIKPYNRGLAVAYAQRWSFERNPAYLDFSSIGGDCTNFISQCLYAGSGVMNYAPDGWYYRSPTDRSPSWTSVEFLERFLTANQTRGPFANLAAQPDMEIGVAAHLMGRLQIRRLPVVEQGKLCGLISLGDLAGYEETAYDAADALTDITSNIR